MNIQKLPFIVSGQAGSACLIGPIVVSAIYVTDAFLEPLIDHVIRVTDSQIKENIGAILPIETVSIPPEKYNSIFTENKSKDEILRWLHGRAVKNLLSCYPETKTIYLGEGSPYDLLSSNLGDIFPQIEIAPSSDCNKQAALAARLSAGKSWARKLDDLFERNVVLQSTGCQHPYKTLVESELRGIAKKMNQRKLASIFKIDLLNK